MRILIVEDNALVGTGLQSALTGAGFEVSWVRDGESALNSIASETFLAMVLDLGLPGISGMEVLQTLRAGGNKMPVLILTARDSTQDKVTGLNSGADDFLTKPVTGTVLLARVRNLLARKCSERQLRVAAHVFEFSGEAIIITERIARRQALIRRAGHDGNYKAGDLVLNMEARTVTQSGELLNLSKREFDVLSVLMVHAGQIVTRKQLEQSLYGTERQMESNSIEVHVHNLRHKIAGKALKTIRGVGYTLGLRP